METKISIIIPVLNEEENIIPLLTYLIKNSSPQNVAEIIVVDGGSTDGTLQRMNHFSALINGRENILRLVNSHKGRATQMNLGAKNAHGEILYFLHADSNPPKDFDHYILSEIKKGYEAGCFRMKFDQKHPVLLVSQWFTRFNHKICRGGDQSLFISKTLFNALKGYNENYQVYEDGELIDRIYQKTRFSVIPKYITTSSRRYQLNGTIKLQYHFMVIHLKKRFGASAEQLHKYYLKNIVS